MVFPAACRIQPHSRVLPDLRSRRRRHHDQHRRVSLASPASNFRYPTLRNRCCYPPGRCHHDPASMPVAWSVNPPQIDC